MCFNDRAKTLTRYINYSSWYCVLIQRLGGFGGKDLVFVKQILITWRSVSQSKRFIPPVALHLSWLTFLATAARDDTVDKHGSKRFQTSIADRLKTASQGWLVHFIVVDEKLL
jgi:hypothetical protein